MALPSSGTISLNMVNVELSKSGTTLISLNQSDVRNLFGKSSGQISMSDGHGKSAYTQMAASCGSKTTVGSYTVHTFTSSGTFSISALGSPNNKVDAYIHAGGGSGSSAGGGGAGGAYTVSNIVMTAGNHYVAVGGTRGTSSFRGNSATAGNNGAPGENGGSSGAPSSKGAPGRGGGGSGAPGSGKNGGAGLNNNYRTGSNEIRGGGGGGYGGCGGCDNPQSSANAGAGGSGGGGKGGWFYHDGGYGDTDYYNGSNATVNTGSGGGGRGGQGSSGIVIIRYPTNSS